VAVLFALTGIAARADSSAAPAALHFARDGEPVATATLSDLLQHVEPSSVRVVEPYEHGEAVFRALPLADVLDLEYSPSWRDEEEILFTCRDGYQPTVPVQRVLEHRAWLAFARTDADSFTIRKLESGRVQQIELSPFYLIWDNRDDAEVLREGDYGWPYQLIGIDLIRARDRFPAMAPPPGASAAAQAGFEAFRIYCSRCHTVNGVGGAIGPELNDPKFPVGRRDPEWLRHWIDDPSRVVATARMPALSADLPDRERVLDDLVAYLQLMAEPAAARSEAPRPGPFEAFYDSPAQHPVALWLAAGVAAALVWTRRGLRPSLRHYALGLVVLSGLDAWLTANQVIGLGLLPPALSSAVPLFFVLAGDFRYLLLATSGTPDGAVAPTGRSLLSAAGLTLVAPIASHALAMAWLEGRADPRSLYLIYELLFFALVASLPRWLPNLRRAPWLRRVGHFVLLYYGLWAAADAILLTTGADLAFGLRVVPNLLYYGGLIGAIAWLAPADPTPRT